MKEQLEQFEKRMELANLLSESGVDVPYNEADHALVDDIIKKACKSYLNELEYKKNK
ncbi:hypothetical protein [Porphyromonas endodontalis]